MAHVYSDMSRPYGRERYSGPAWMGMDGERAVDLAWKDKESAVDSWQGYEPSFPADRREDARDVYRTALAVMRGQMGVL